MSISKNDLLMMLDDVDSVVKNCPNDSVFDVIETYTNCTVEVLRNTKTGEVSVGFYKNMSKQVN